MFNLCWTKLILNMQYKITFTRLRFFASKNRASSRALRSSHSFRKHSVLREARVRAACIPAYCKRLDRVERHICGQPVCPWRHHRQRCLPALTCSHFARSPAEALHTAAGWPGPEGARGFSPVATVRFVAVWHQSPRCSRTFCAAFSLLPPDFMISAALTLHILPLTYHSLLLHARTHLCPFATLREQQWR